VTLAITGNTETEIVITGSIVVPLVVTGVLAWIFLRGKGHDPDEQRWRRLDEQRRAEAAAAQRRAEAEANDRR
jgi:hypothetical protein